MSKECTIIQRCIGPATLTEGNSVPPHPNVALRAKQGTCKFEGESGGQCSEEFHAIFHLTANIETRLARQRSSENDDDTVAPLELGNENLKNILLQLGHAVYHLHSNNWSHGDITTKNVFCSDTERNVFLTHPSAVFKTSSATTESKIKDIKSLGKVFSYMIEKAVEGGKLQHFDEKTKDDLLEKMEKKYVCAEEILQHPFFWSTHKKISFIERVTCVSKSGENGGLKRKINLESATVLKGNGWISNLEIKGQELHEYQKALNKRRKGSSNKKILNTEVIKDLTKTREDEKKVFYEDTEVQSLLKFIRNRYEHFWQDSLPVQACYKFNPVDGFWNFYFSRFPNLFSVVYNVAKQHAESYPDTELSSDYFNRVEENRSLPRKRRITST